MPHQKISLYCRKYVLYALSLELVLSEQRNRCLTINCLHYTEDGQNIWTNAENKIPVITLFCGRNTCKTGRTATRERRLLSWSAYSFLSFRLLCQPCFLSSFLYSLFNSLCVLLFWPYVCLCFSFLLVISTRNMSLNISVDPVQ